MNDDVRKLIYGAIVLFLGTVTLWILLVYVSACGLTLTCHQAAPFVDRTPIPTLIPVKLPAATKFVKPAATATLEGGSETPVSGVSIPRPSNPGGPGQAVGLTGNIDNGQKVFVTNCRICHGEEGKSGDINPGTLAGKVPTLNPIDLALKDADFKIFATNLDLFIEHGSVPKGIEPARSMPRWGDSGALTPQEIADVIAYLISLNK